VAGLVRVVFGSQLEGGHLVLLVLTNQGFDLGIYQLFLLLVL